MQRCPKCDAPNPDNLENCYYCNTKLESLPIPQQSTPPPVPAAPLIKAVRRDKVHVLLKECASNFIILGYVIAIATMVCGTIWAMILREAHRGPDALVVSIVTFVGAGVPWTVFRAASGIIRLIIRIEENTRPIPEDSPTPVS